MAAKEFGLKNAINVADKTPGTLLDKVSQFELIASKGLRGVIWPDEELTVVFFRFTDGKPEFFVRDFRGSALGGTEMPAGLQVQCSRPCGDLPPAYFGTMDAILRVLAQKPEMAQIPPIPLARQLVQTEIDEEPKSVGPPIAELSIWPDHSAMDCARSVFLVVKPHTSTTAQSSLKIAYAESPRVQRALNIPRHR
jgi:hypothetical protein